MHVLGKRLSDGDQAMPEEEKKESESNKRKKGADGKMAPPQS